MEKEICISKLKQVAELYNIRIWIAEKMGRRWSYVIGAGKELFLPSQMITKIGKYAIFVEGDQFDKEVIIDDVRKLLESQDLQKSKGNVGKR